MLDLDLLRSFVSVVDAGGFTRAGERVHRTQSTVSQQIKRLEEDVGQPLLNRSGKDVTPTEAGERLLSYARRLLSLAEEARDVLGTWPMPLPTSPESRLRSPREWVCAFCPRSRFWPIIACSPPRTALRRSTRRRSRWWPRPMRAPRRCGSPIGWRNFARACR